jgi:hypothetical protein
MTLETKTRDTSFNPQSAIRNPQFFPLRAAAAANEPPAAVFNRPLIA